MTMQHKITGKKIKYRPMIEAELTIAERDNAIFRAQRTTRIARLTAAKLCAASKKIIERKPGMARWYCLHVVNNKESLVENKLFEANVEVLVPTEKWARVHKGEIYEGVRPLFPGYVLVRIVPSAEAFQSLKALKFVVDFVGGNKGYHIVRDADVEALQKFNTDTDVPRVATDKTICDGDIAEITFGPFAGFSCLIVAVKWCRQARAKIAIDVMGKAFEIESMPLAFLKKL